MTPSLRRLRDLTSESRTIAPERAYLDLFEARRGALPGTGQSWVAALRERAAAVLAERGIPSRRVEAWKYSDIRLALADAPFTLAPQPVKAVRIAPLAGVETLRILFVNGRYAGADAPEAGMEIMPLGEALAAPPEWVAHALGQVNRKPDHPLIGLNTALMEDGVLIRLAPGAAPPRPFEIVFLWQGDTDQAGAHLRLLVVAEAGARAVLIERHIAQDRGARLMTITSEMSLHEGARLSHVKLHQDGEEARHLAAILGMLAKGARYEGFYHSQGAKLARNEVQLRLEGESAEVVLTGTSLLSGARHCDNTTVIEHGAGSAKSRQLFKAAIAGHAHGVFQGRVSVAPGAQKTDADQVTRAILLSERAEMSAKPELEILAHDVRCTHGAAIGPLDEAAVFYLGTRGLPEEAARRLLVAGFMEEAIARLPLAALKAVLLEETEQWLAKELAP